MRGAAISPRPYRALAAAICLLAGGAAAEEARKVGGHQDWSLFSDYDLCWAATTAVNDPGTVLMSAFKVEGGVESSVSFAPPAPKGPLRATFRLTEWRGFAEDGWGWLTGPEEDMALHGALMTAEAGQLVLNDGARNWRFSAAGYKWLMEVAPELCLQPMS